VTEPRRAHGRRSGRERAAAGALLAALLLAALVGGAGCRENRAPAAKDRASHVVASSRAVGVSIAPQRYFVRQLLGDEVTVHVLVRQEQSPATYDPSPKEMAAVTGAGVFFRVGVPFEAGVVPRLKRLAPDLAVVDVREGIRMRPVPHHGGRADPDPHFWLDPLRSLTMAQTMARTLAERRPERAATIRANLARLELRLRALNEDLTRALAPVRGRTLFAYHGAYGYFCERYHLEQRALASGSKEPGGRLLAGFIKAGREAGARTVFVQPQFSHSEAEVVAREIGARVVVLDPLASDYVANLRRIARAVLRALES